jgi:hypothetical protein
MGFDASSEPQTIAIGTCQRPVPLYLPSLLLAGQPPFHFVNLEGWLKVVNSEKESKQLSASMWWWKVFLLSSSSGGGSSIPLFLSRRR